jgi:hypothetical protein
MLSLRTQPEVIIKFGSTIDRPPRFMYGLVRNLGGIKLSSPYADFILKFGSRNDRLNYKK